MHELQLRACSEEPFQIGYCDMTRFCVADDVRNEVDVDHPCPRIAFFVDVFEQLL